MKIKYRIFDSINKTFEYIDFDNLNDVIQILDVYKIELGNSYFNNSNNLMQFIGIVDDNGVEIYEGDICRLKGGECFNGMYEFDKIGTFKRQGIIIDFIVDDAAYGFGYCLEYSSITIIGNIKKI